MTVPTEMMRVKALMLGSSCGTRILSSSMVYSCTTKVTATETKIAKAQPPRNVAGPQTPKPNAKPVTQRLTKPLLFPSAHCALTLLLLRQLLLITLLQPNRVESPQAHQDRLGWNGGGLGLVLVGLVRSPSAYFIEPTWPYVWDKGPILEWHYEVRPCCLDMPALRGCMPDQGVPALHGNLATSLAAPVKEGWHIFSCSCTRFSRLSSCRKEDSCLCLVAAVGCPWCGCTRLWSNALLRPAHAAATAPVASGPRLVGERPIKEVVFSALSKAGPHHVSANWLPWTARAFLPQGLRWPEGSSSSNCPSSAPTIYCFSTCALILLEANKRCVDMKPSNRMVIMTMNIIPSYHYQFPNILQSWLWDAPGRKPFAPHYSAQTSGWKSVAIFYALQHSESEQPRSIISDAMPPWMLAKNWEALFVLGMLDLYMSFLMLRPCWCRGDPFIPTRARCGPQCGKHTTPCIVACSGCDSRMAKSALQKFIFLCAHLLLILPTSESHECRWSYVTMTLWHFWDTYLGME